MLLSVFSFNSFSQQIINTNQPLTRQDYLKASKDQKIAAFVTLGAGLALLALASSGNSDFSVTGVMVVNGGISVLSSIPLFIASGRNKRRANAVAAYVNIERISNSPLLLNSKASFPALSIKIPL